MLDRSEIVAQLDQLRGIVAPLSEVTRDVRKGDLEVERGQLARSPLELGPYEVPAESERNALTEMEAGATASLRRRENLRRPVLRLRTAWAGCYVSPNALILDGDSPEMLGSSIARVNAGPAPTIMSQFSCTASRFF